MCESVKQRLPDLFTTCFIWNQRYTKGNAWDFWSSASDPVLFERCTRVRDILVITYYTVEQPLATLPSWYVASSPQFWDDELSSALLFVSCMGAEITSAVLSETADQPMWSLYPPTEPYKSYRWGSWAWFLTQLYLVFIKSPATKPVSNIF